MGPEGGCPVGLLCLTVPARVAWARWTLEVARWAAQTWIECGPMAPHVDDNKET